MRLTKERVRQIESKALDKLRHVIDKETPEITNFGEVERQAVGCRPSGSSGANNRKDNNRKQTTTAIPQQCWGLERTHSNNRPRYIVALRRKTIPQRLDDQPLGPPAVDRRRRFPATGRVQFARRHGNQHLVVHEQRLEVRVAVTFAGAVVQVVLANGARLRATVDVRQQSRLVVVDEDAGR